MLFLAVMYAIHQRTDMRNIIRNLISGRRGSLSIQIFALAFLFLIGPAAEAANEFTNSAHGDATVGVNRSDVSGFPTDYPIGFCAHCHEQHASIGGSEPTPTGGPSDYLLFYDNHTSQTDNFCYKCHTGSGSLQYSVSGITNYLYAERAGGWSSVAPDDILEAFSYSNGYNSSNPDTSHNLDNISTFITGKWNYTADSNPCIACHNPHAAQGDPLGNGGGSTSSKTTTLGNRGWVISKPSLHSTDNSSWGLWGDGSGEKMSDYASNLGDTYQAPYRYNSTSAYEPDGSGVTDGSNLADYVTFCSECHNDTYTSINSSTLGRNLYSFAWAGDSADKHGGADAVDDGVFGSVTIDDLENPYNEALYKYVLACTDCHEPHGSANLFMIREGVNGGSSLISVTKPASESPDNTKEWKNLCEKCHDVSTSNNKAIHHRAYQQEYGSNYMYCIYCHEPEATDMRNCLKCHYHGNTEWPAVDEYGLGPHTYDGSGSTEKMF